MPDLSFSIEFHKTGNRKLSLDDKREAIEQACFQIESLVFFMAEREPSGDVDDGEELKHYHQNIAKLINGFVNSILSNFADIENRREHLEDLLPKLAKSLNKKAKKSETEFSQNLTIPEDEMKKIYAISQAAQLFFLENESLEEATKTLTDLGYKIDSEKVQRYINYIKSLEK